jgi:hypothetical protein
MKKFLYIVTWVQLVLSTLYTFFYGNLNPIDGVFDQTVVIDINTWWILTVVLYIAWRVTPPPTKA